MVSNLSTRIAELEEKTFKMPKAFILAYAGARPTPDEQLKIDAAEVRGEFVIVIAPGQHVTELEE